MATSSKCPGCGSYDDFEAKPLVVKGYKYKLIFIQCSSCGHVVGVTSHYDAGVIAHENRDMLKEIKKRLGI